MSHPTDLSTLIEESLSAYLADPAKNNLGPVVAGGTPTGTDWSSLPAWSEHLLAFSRGDDPLYAEMKAHIGPFHWTPAEAFALSRPGTSVDPAELTVVSWVLCQTPEAKAAETGQDFYPSETWVRARIFGQKVNDALNAALAQALEAEGYQVASPSLLPQMSTKETSKQFGRASTWSERHVAYISGLGTFGLSGGLITEKGVAMRLGSLVVRAEIPATPRAYDDPFAYCLHYTQGTCGLCAKRCVTGSVTLEGRDKEPCFRHLFSVTSEYVQREFGLAGYGCGLCQTGVPCESGIPAATGHTPSARLT